MRQYPPKVTRKDSFATVTIHPAARTHPTLRLLSPPAAERQSSVASSEILAPWPYGHRTRSPPPAPVHASTLPRAHRERPGPPPEVPLQSASSAPSSKTPSSATPPPPAIPPVQATTDSATHSPNGSAT